MGDHPFREDPSGEAVDFQHYPAWDDIGTQLARLMDLFAPIIAVGIVKALWRVIETDDNILPRAKQLFRARVDEVLGVEL